MNISGLFIRRPVMTTLVMAAILIFGLIAYRQLPVSDLPPVDYPTISVSASLPGASSETMASSVATPLEKQFSTIAGLETQYCRVVWHCDEFVGLEFETPLAEAVLDRLLQDHEGMSEAAIQELRDIAARTHRLAASQPDAEIQRLAELSNRCAVEAVIEGFRLRADGASKAPPSPHKPD